jgi:hypothetical protein
LVTKREDLRLQGSTGSKTGGYQSEKGDEKRAHRGSHHDLTNDRNLCVFRSDEVFGIHRLDGLADRQIPLPSVQEPPPTYAEPSSGQKAVPTKKQGALGETFAGILALHT